MTPSTTNTAARELFVELRGLVALWRQREHGERTEHDEGYELASDECALVLERAIDKFETTLTQQQGGEQEAGEIMAGMKAPIQSYGKSYTHFLWLSPAPYEYPPEGMLLYRADDVERAIAAALRTKQPAASEGDGRKVIERIKLRLHFDGWPGESMWNAGTEESPRWIGDWRYEIALIENYLHGSPITVPEKPTDTIRRNEIPNTSKQAAGEAVDCGGCAPAVYAAPRRPADEGMAVDDAMVERALNAHAGGYVVRDLLMASDKWTRQLMRAAIDAALAGSP